ASVRFTGFRRDAANLMNAIDIMALPSHREPFGLVYLEAAILQKPVVACAAGGALESIAHGESGLLAPVGDEVGIAEAIGALLDNRAWAGELGRRGRERVIDLFNWNRFTRRLETVYEKVLAGDASATPRRDAA
ncbi:MAG: glycosyltransferase family 4 protein, partial [Planctomycetota bacterium]